ncbi:MAG: thioredoxin family protein [Alkalinema sp. RU_4_3]|nr:thioredoxin family protein [Alkalinema sp. RU_4_3]
MRQVLVRWFWAGVCALVMGLGLLPGAAMAVLTDDRYDGEIFALYAGNGSLVPPKVTLEQSIAKGKPALVVFYIDDSADCKTYATVISNVQALYGREANLMPIRVDSLEAKDSYEPTDPGYYYKGYVPQTLLFDQNGKVRLDEQGQVPFEKIDDTFRQIFDLLPREESAVLKRRQINEVSTELSK